jgi:hypothetical protein
MLNSSDVEIIAFLQNTLTKEVYQAFSVVRPQVLVGIENPSAHEVHFSLYPNPANDKLTVHFGSPLRDNARIVIYSIKGEAVREYRAGRGLVEFTVNDPSLKEGLYLVRVSIGLYDQGYQKLIITDD